MSQTARLYQIDQLLHDRKVVSFAALQEALGVSRATLKRDLEYMRSRLNAPIEWSREAGGYRFTQSEQTLGPSYALPKLWFNEREIHALLTMQHLLDDMGAGGILAQHVAPLMSRLNALLGSASDSAEDIRQKVLIASVGRRPLPLARFQHIGRALLNGQRICIHYAARSTEQTTEREVSPLRLVHYRENWYLDAWCHLRNEIRNFSVDRVEQVQVLDKAAKKISQKRLDNTLGPGYGIFAHGPVQWARLRFSAYRARWVASEQWHPEQRGHFEADGSYLLEVPYVDDRELVMDILRFGADCEVVGPRFLRTRVAKDAAALTKMYSHQIQRR
jgi:predicted DNA-binding transcriptional regulator YafY